MHVLFQVELVNMFCFCLYTSAGQISVMQGGKYSGPEYSGIKRNRQTQNKSCQKFGLFKKCLFSGI
jgi:hypothetical protein